MNDSCKTTVLVGVAGGYLLGRTKKARLALTLAALVAGRRLAPQELLKSGARKLADTPQLAGLSDQVRDQMMTAARTAVGSLVDRRVASFTDSLRVRTDRLGASEKEEDDEEESGARAEEDDGHDRRKAAPKRRPPGRRKTGRTTGPATAGARKKTASGNGGGGRGTAKSAKPAGRSGGRQRS